MITCAVGDLHGCLDELKLLIDKMKRYQGRTYVKWVFLGDYIDRGPDSKGVVDFLLNFSKTNNCTFLMGNHEDMMLDAINTGSGSYHLWSNNSGEATINSYPDKKITDEHMIFFKTLEYNYQTKTHFFCHAGVHPSYSLDDQIDSDLIWIRQTFLKSPHDWGKIIVHGHTPLQTFQVEVKPNRINIDTGCVFGGFLTAAVFDDEQTDPKFIQVPKNR